LQTSDEKSIRPLGVQYCASPCDEMSIGQGRRRSSRVCEASQSGSGVTSFPNFNNVAANGYSSVYDSALNRHGSSVSRTGLPYEVPSAVDVSTRWCSNSTQDINGSNCSGAYFAPVRASFANVMPRVGSGSDFPTFNYGVESPYSSVSGNEQLPNALGHRFGGFPMNHCFSGQDPYGGCAVSTPNYFNGPQVINSECQAVYQQPDRETSIVYPSYPSSDFNMRPTPQRHDHSRFNVINNPTSGGGVQDHLGLHGMTGSSPHQPMNAVEQTLTEDRNGKARIFVTRLPWDVTAEDLRRYFLQFGEVLDSYCPRNPCRPRQNKGFGFISFRYMESAGEALQYGPHRIMSRVVVVDHAAERSEKVNAQERNGGGYYNNTNNNGITRNGVKETSVRDNDVQPIGGSSCVSPSQMRLPTRITNDAFGQYGSHNQYISSGRWHSSEHGSRASPRATQGGGSDDADQVSGGRTGYSNGYKPYLRVDECGASLPRPVHGRPKVGYGSHHSDNRLPTGNVTSRRRHKLFVGRLNPETTAGGLKRYFEKFGEVIDSYIPRDPESFRSRGFGFVTFLDPGCVDTAMREGNHCIDSKEIAIDIADADVRTYQNTTPISSVYANNPAESMVATVLK